MSERDYNMGIPPAPPPLDTWTCAVTGCPQQHTDETDILCNAHMRLAKIAEEQEKTGKRGDDVVNVDKDGKISPLVPESEDDMAKRVESARQELEASRQIVLILEGRTERECASIVEWLVIHFGKEGIRR